MVRGCWFVAVAMVVASAARAEVAREALVPAGGTPLVRVHAEGVQIYECVAAAGGTAWRFREPLATLIEDGKTVGRHFAGPGWEMNDGSLVRGRVVEQAPGESGRDIPWLRLAVVGRSGDGVLGKVTTVVRAATRGGVFGGACDTVGALHLEPYSAAYWFFAGDLGLVVARFTMVENNALAVECRGWRGLWPGWGDGDFGGLLADAVTRDCDATS